MKEKILPVIATNSLLYLRYVPGRIIDPLHIKDEVVIKQIEDIVKTSGLPLKLIICIEDEKKLELKNSIDLYASLVLVHCIQQYSDQSLGLTIEVLDRIILKDVSSDKNGTRANYTIIKDEEVEDLEALETLFQNTLKDFNLHTVFKVFLSIRMGSESTVDYISRHSLEMTSNSYVIKVPPAKLYELLISNDLTARLLFIKSSMEKMKSDQVSPKVKNK
jgi:ATP-dependent Lon protease